MNEIITVDQQAVLTSRFDAIAAELEVKRQRIEALVVSEESYKDAKAIRAELNKESKELAAEFKGVKEIVLKPWNDIEAEYKQKISKPYIDIDGILKTKINDIEDGLKAQKIAEVEKYSRDYATAIGVDTVIAQEILGKTSIGLSKSITALKKEIKTKLDSVKDDLTAIGDDAEVLAEYRGNGYQLAQAMQSVKERHEAIKRAEAEAKRIAAEEADAEALEKELREYEAELEAARDKVVARVKTEVPELADEELVCIEFQAIGTRYQLKALRTFMSDNNIRFESI